MGKARTKLAVFAMAAAAIPMLAGCNASSKGGTGVPPVSAASAEPDAQDALLAGEAGNTGGTPVPPEVPTAADHAAIKALVGTQVFVVGVASSRGKQPQFCERTITACTVNGIRSATIAITPPPMSEGLGWRADEGRTVCVHGVLTQYRFVDPPRNAQSTGAGWSACVEVADPAKDIELLAAADAYFDHAGVRALVGKEVTVEGLVFYEKSPSLLVMHGAEVNGLRADTLTLLLPSDDSGLRERLMYRTVRFRAVLVSYGGPSEDVSTEVDPALIQRAEASLQNEAFKQTRSEGVVLDPETQRVVAHFGVVGGTLRIDDPYTHVERFDDSPPK